MNFKNLKLISGDASFRKFYKGKQGLIVYSTKEKKSIIPKIIDGR